MKKDNHNRGADTALAIGIIAVYAAMPLAIWPATRLYALGLFLFGLAYCFAVAFRNRIHV